MYCIDGEKHYFKEECSEMSLMHQAKDFSMGVKRCFITEMLIALKEIHDEGLVHGNILPESFRLNNMRTHVKFDYLQSKPSDNVDDKRRDVERVQKLIFMLVCNEADYENIKSLRSNDLRSRAKEVLGDSYKIFYDFLQQLSEHGCNAGLSHPFLWKPDKWICFLSSLHDIHKNKPELLKSVEPPSNDWIERLKLTAVERYKWFSYDPNGLFYRQALAQLKRREINASSHLLRLIVYCCQQFYESRDWESKHLELEHERLRGELQRLESGIFSKLNEPRKQVRNVEELGKWVRPTRERERKQREMDRVNHEIIRDSSIGNWQQKEQSKAAAISQQIEDCKEQEAERMNDAIELRSCHERWVQEPGSALFREGSVTADIFKFFQSRFPTFLCDLYLFVKANENLRRTLICYFEVEKNL